jgi:hypothetical protein
MNTIEIIKNHMNGPFRNLIVPIVCKELNIDEKTIESVLVLLQSGKGTKEQHDAIKNILTIFEKVVKDQYGIDFHVGEISIDNQISARNMAVANKSKIPGFLSIVITLGFFSVLGYMLFNDSKPNETILIMLGSLGTAWIAVVNYWFGSSSGSAYKSELLERMNTK